MTHKVDITDHDRTLISQAIIENEAHTNAEIFVVLAEQSDDYFYPSAFIASFITLFLAIIAAFWFHWSWRTIGLHSFGLGILIFYVICLAYLWMIPRLRLFLTPISLQKKRSHANAVQQFLAHNVHKTPERTAILIFISMAEHYAEIIADTAINDKVQQQQWQSIIDDLKHNARGNKIAEGIVNAVDQSGKLLAHYFPHTKSDKNYLPDHLVEL